jgi:cytoskeletal protein CcmA (bactofilin family)
MSATVAPIFQMPEPRGSAVIGKSVTITGQIFSREDLTIDGEVEGSVELQEHRLIVGLTGKLRADVKANDIVVLGSIHGHVEARDKIDIRKHARISGDIIAARLVTEDGAYLKGSVDTQGRQVSHQAPTHLEVAS